MRFQIDLAAGDDVVGIIRLLELDTDEEVVPRAVASGVNLGELLRQASNGSLSLGQLEVNLDFDSDGRLVSLEFYN